MKLLHLVGLKMQEIQELSDESLQVAISPVVPYTPTDLGFAFETTKSDVLKTLEKIADNNLHEVYFTAKRCLYKDNRHCVINDVKNMKTLEEVFATLWYFEQFRDFYRECETEQLPLNGEFNGVKMRKLLANEATKYAIEWGFTSDLKNCTNVIFDKVKLDVKQRLRNKKSIAPEIEKSIDRFIERTGGEKLKPYLDTEQIIEDVLNDCCSLSDLDIIVSRCYDTYYFEVN